MSNETITVKQLEELKSKLGRLSHRLNQQHRAGSRTAVTAKVTLDLMEVAALEIALERLLQSIPKP